MQYFPRLTLVQAAALLLLVVCPFLAQGANENLAYHKLPSDSMAPVIVLDRSSFFTLRLKEKEPLLVIRADGTTTVATPNKKWKRIETKISQERIQELLRFALDENDFFEFDAKKAQEEIGERKPKVRDLSTTKIRIQADGRDKSVSWYALGMAAQRFKIKALVQLDAVGRELERLRTEIYAGGQEQILKHLELANTKLKAEHPDLPPLSVTALGWAAQYTDETSILRFHRKEKLSDGQTRYTTIEIKYAAGDEPEVKVNVRLDERKLKP